MPAHFPISNDVLVNNIIETGNKVSSIETKIDIFLVDQASLKVTVSGLREDVDDLIQQRHGDRRYLAGISVAISVILSVLMPFGMAWAMDYFGL